MPPNQVSQKKNEKYLETHVLQKLTEEEIENLKKSITSKDIELVTENLQQ